MTTEIESPTIELCMYQKVAQDCSAEITENNLNSNPPNCNLNIEPQFDLVKLGNYLVEHKGYRWDGEAVVSDRDDFPEYHHIRLLCEMPVHGTHLVHIYVFGKVEIGFAF